MMKKRAFSCLMALILLFLTLQGAAASASASVSAPIYRAVNDDAAVLSDMTAKDVEVLNDRAEDIPLKFAVVTRHFLGGAAAQEYCDTLFEAWGASADMVILLLVIGEERYAVSTGAMVDSFISREQMNTLLSGKLRGAFIDERDYDGAVGQFLLAVTDHAARAQNTSINTNGLFGTQVQNVSQQSANTIFDNWNGQWWSGFFAEESEDEDIVDRFMDDDSYEVYYEAEADGGFSIGKLAIIAIVLVFISSRRAAKGKKGLGAAGWIVAGMGAKEVMKGAKMAKNVQRYTRHRRGPRG